MCCFVILDPVFVEIRPLAAHHSDTVVAFSEVITRAKVALLVDFVAAVANTVHHVTEGNLADQDEEGIVRFVRVRVVHRKRELVCKVDSAAESASIVAGCVRRLDAKTLLEN